MNFVWFGESLSAYAFQTGITILKVCFACLSSYDHDFLLPAWFSKGISAKSYWSCAPGEVVFRQSCQSVQKELVLRLNYRSNKISYLVVAGLGITAVPAFSKNNTLNNLEKEMVAKRNRRYPIWTTAGLHRW